MFCEQNVHLEVGIEFDNGALHHVASHTFLTSINNQKGGGGIIEHMELRLPIVVFQHCTFKQIFFKTRIRKGRGDM